MSKNKTTTGALGTTGLMRQSNTKEGLGTSKEWLDTMLISNPSIILMDPDGWDKGNYEYSFNQELISHNEFVNRMNNSTVLIRKKIR